MTLAPACAHKEKTPVERGQGVFLRSCAGCHGPNAKGTKPAGFTTFPKDLTDPNLQARLDDDGLRDTIRYGKGQMPPFGANLAEPEVTDLIAFIRSIKRTPRP